MKKNIISAITLIFMFSIQSSYAMDCLGWLCCVSQKNNTYEPVPNKIELSKKITPIQAHYNAFIKTMPKLNNYQDVAEAIEIVNNAKNKHAITEQDLGLFMLTQEHSENFNKGAAVIVALIECYNKEIHEKKIPVLTRTETLIYYIERPDNIAIKKKEQTLHLIDIIGLKKPTITNTNDETQPHHKLGINIAIVRNNPKSWNEMVKIVYKDKEISDKSLIPLDEDSL